MIINKQNGAAITQMLLWVFVLTNSAALGCYYYVNYMQADEVPNMIGTWTGENVTVSDEKGYKEWANKTVTITEQKDRRFRGTFTYADGTKHFFGVIYPDNKTFTWVSTPSKGFNHGRILDKNTIGACYVETYENATAGCATLHRK